MTPEALTMNDALSTLAVALGAGLLVGLEREQPRSDDRRLGGIRTFGLISLLGAVGGMLRPALGWWVPALLAALVAVLVAGSALGTHANNSAKGLTTEVAALVVHVLGLLAATPVAGLSALERWGLVSAISITTMALLSLGQALHNLAQRVSSEDLYATAKLGVVLLVALPVLPRTPLRWLPQIVPFEVGLMVALIAAVGFLGYILVRLLGPGRGMVLTGMVGGLVSSTAVTLSFASRVRETKQLAPIAALGIALASIIMLARMLLVIAVVAPTLLFATAIPLGAMGVVGGAVSGVLYLKHQRSTDAATGGDMAVRNPFALDRAVLFGLFYMVILVISNLANEHFGRQGLYISSLLAGLTNVDAITLTVGRLHRDGLDAETASIAVAIAACANTAVKGSLAFALGGSTLGGRVAGIFVPMIAVGLGALLLS